MVADRMRSNCASDLNKMGLEVISFTIKEVRDKNEYIANMGRPDIARVSATPTSQPLKPSATRPSSAPKLSRAAAVAKAKADQERVMAETLSLTAQAEAQRDLETKRALYIEAVKEAAGAGRQDIRDTDQYHAAAGCRRGGKGTSGGERTGDPGTGSRNSAPGTRTDCNRSEAGGSRTSRIETLAEAERLRN